MYNTFSMSLYRNFLFEFNKKFHVASAYYLIRRFFLVSIRSCVNTLTKAEITCECQIHRILKRVSPSKIELRKFHRKTILENCMCYRISEM